VVCNSSLLHKLQWHYNTLGAVYDAAVMRHDKHQPEWSGKPPPHPVG